MANPRILTKRRKAVRNIRKITRTMQLIATSRFQKSLNRATASRPYADRITELVQQLSSAGGQVEHPLLEENPEAPGSALLVITANRGMCGGYNSSLLRTAGAQLGRDPAVDLNVVGKKGVVYFRFLGREMNRAVADFPDAPQFADVEPIAEEFMAQYREGRYRAIHVVYMQFRTVAQQMPMCIQLLPIQRQAADASADEVKSTAPRAETQYDFSPAPEELLAELLPATVKVRLFQCFMDATVSEQVARMVAMKAATDAADDMIKMLSRRYNRARQSQITNELLDIIGGAEALK